jgi:alpha-tubulin suppressor-like RCC1 family protein
MNMRLSIALFISTFAPYSVFSVTPDISAGARHVLALKDNGEVWTWGDNREEQLGQPSGGASSVHPILVNLPAGRTGVQVAAGDGHSLVLLDNGIVFSFGLNDNQQLGRAGRETAPGIVAGLDQVTAVAAGWNHSLALKRDGSVWSFGSNRHGQLGNGTTMTSAAPVRVEGLNDVIAIAAGFGSSYALKRNGTVFAWGANDRGQLGHSNGTHQTRPAQILNLSGVRAIAAGGVHASALKSDGTVWSWGFNYFGQLGNSTATHSSPEPLQAQGITDATQVAAGWNYTMVVRGSGSLWTFGLNDSGQLGLEEAWRSSMIASPQASVLTGGVEKVTAGKDSTYASTYALKKDGTVSAFGLPIHGKMGDGQSVEANRPVQLYGETAANKVACGVSHSIIRRVDGSIGWVGNYDGQNRVIGERNPNDQTYRLKVLSSLGTITQVASGDHHTLALRSDGTVWAYGYGANGQLGDEKNASSMVPVQVKGLTSIKAIAAGGSSSLAIKQDDSVVAWGANESGQLGNGTTANQSTPVAVTGLSQITSIAMGKNHAIARKSDGTAWIWGNNELNQLESGGAKKITIPKQVSSFTTTVESVAAGYAFSLALLNDHSVKSWGLNHVGQLGLGDTTLHSILQGSLT